MRSMITKNCEWCGLLFTQEKKRKPRFCGRRCASVWRNRNQPGASAARLKRRCESCGAAVLSIQADARFCSHKCGLLGRRKGVYSKEVREQRSEQMRRLNSRSDVQAKRAAFLASGSAPFKQPEVKRKSIEKQRKAGFPTLIRGYKAAAGPTVPQKFLFDALAGLLIEMEYRIGGRFRVDLAIPSLQLAIEVDGLSHTSQKGKKADAAKEQILKDRGWTLLRFRNEEVLSSFPSVLARIKSAIAMLPESAEKTAALEGAA